MHTNWQIVLFFCQHPFLFTKYLKVFFYNTTIVFSMTPIYWLTSFLPLMVLLMTTTWQIDWPVIHLYFVRIFMIFSCNLSLLKKFISKKNTEILYFEGHNKLLQKHSINTHTSKLFSKIIVGYLLHPSKVYINNNK
jgi:hypothetical protein